MARTQVPLRDLTEESESFTYSTEAAGQGDVEEHKKRRRARRKRRPKPEAIVARLKTDQTEGEPQNADSPVQPEPATVDAAGTPAAPAEGVAGENDA